MFYLINDLPAFTVGIIMKGKVTRSDFDSILVPKVKKVCEEWKGINLLLVQETGFENFTLGAWLKDASVNFTHFFKWNKIAWVRSEETDEDIFKIFDFFIPGEVKIFKHSKLEEAKVWVSEP